MHTRIMEQIYIYHGHELRIRSLVLNERFPSVGPQSARAHMQLHTLHTQTLRPWGLIKITVNVQNRSTLFRAAPWQIWQRGCEG